jgi:enolase
MTTISRIHAREVLDSRGNPTVEVEVHCANGAMGRAIVPSGASTGKHEAVELRDGDPNRFGGKGVRKAVANVKEKIAPEVIGLEPTQQERIDRLMIDLDGTPNKASLGANAILGVSLAVAHASAAVLGVPLRKYLARGRKPKLPLPMVNMISGGLHAGGNLDFQDFLLMPIGATTFSEALEIVTRVYRRLGSALKNKGFEGALVGDEGGFGPRLRSNEEVISVLVEAMNPDGYLPGSRAAIAIDVAASQFYHNGPTTDYGVKPEFYRLSTGTSGDLSSTAMIQLLEQVVGKYPVLSIEDGLDESDWEGWELLTRRLGSRIQLIGDDLFVTNREKLEIGIERKVANAILIKPNQIGTLTETLQVIDMARAAGYRPVISARSGETEDTTIADLAVATGAGQIKIGSVARSERLAKYNQLLRIEEELPGPENFAAWEPVGGR